MDGLREAGAAEQGAALACRAAAHALLDNPGDVAILPMSLERPGLTRPGPAP